VMSDQMNAPFTNRTAALELFSGDPEFMASLAKGMIALETPKAISYYCNVPKRSLNQA
jgi:hypothetical protein